MQDSSGRHVWNTIPVSDHTLGTCPHMSQLQFEPLTRSNEGLHHKHHRFQHLVMPHRSRRAGVLRGLHLLVFGSPKCLTWLEFEPWSVAIECRVGRIATISPSRDIIDQVRFCTLKPHYAHMRRWPYLMTGVVLRARVVQHRWKAT